MAKRLAIPSQESKLTLVSPYSTYNVPRVQRVTLNTDLPSTDIFEVGNNTQAGTTIDTPNITVSFSVFDVGIRLFAALTGNNPDAYPGGGVDISGFKEVDGIIYIKDPDVNDYIKSGHAKRLQVRDFSFSYTVDGESTEDYTLIGAEKRWFKQDVVVDVFTTGTTTFTLSQTPTQLKNGNYALSVILDNDYLTEVTAAPATGEYRVVGVTLTTGDTRTQRVVAVYQANPAGNNWSYISDAVQPAGVRGRDIKVAISANDILRVQSVNINGNMNVQGVRELGNRNVVGYQKQTPSVDGTITVLDTDTELIDLLVTGSTNSGDTEFELGQSCVGSGLSLKIQLIDPCDSTSPYTVLKTVYIPSITIIGDSYSLTVNQNATQAFNFKSKTGEVYIYSGAF
jgi:hypothetical protein